MDEQIKNILKIILCIAALYIVLDYFTLNKEFKVLEENYYQSVINNIDDTSVDWHMQERSLELLKNKDALMFYARRGTVASEDYKQTFLNIAATQEATLGDYYKEFSGVITYQKVNPVHTSNMEGKEYHYFYEDKYVKELYMAKNDGNYIYPLGSNIIRIDYVVNEETKELVEINDIILKVNFDVMYGVEVIDLKGDYEILTPLPAKEVEIKIKKEIDFTNLIKSTIKGSDSFKPKEFDYQIKINVQNDL